MASSEFINVIFSSGPAVSSIFLILILLSIFSWAIIIAKAIQLKKEDKNDALFAKQFNENKNLGDLFENFKIAQELGREPQGLAVIFYDSYREIQQFEKRLASLNYSDQEAGSIKASLDETVNRTLTRLKNQEQARRDTYIGVLATASNVGPFVGLLGTVIGIVNAFQAIGKMGSADLAFVAPAISEALIATALGLFVAIPSSVAFNYFKNKNQKLNEVQNRFCLYYQNRIQERNIFDQRKADGQPPK